MNTVRHRYPLLFCLATLSGCGNDAAAPVTEAFAATNVAVSNWIDTAGRCAPDHTLHIEGAGASNLGAVSIRQSHCFSPTAANPLAFHDGRFTNTFDDGSVFEGTYSGASVPTANPAVFGIAAQWQVTGGTGGYARATGNGTAAGQANVQTGAGTISLTGTITR